MVHTGTDLEIQYGRIQMNKSYTVQTRIVRYEDLNGQHRLFGGRLMEWIDECAGIAARRYCRSDIITASIDKLSFLRGAHLNDTIVLEAQMTYTGHTSMEVMVKTFIESHDGERTLINTAYLVEVALDKNEKPCAVPQFVPETDEEKENWNEANERNALRKHRKDNEA